MKCRPSESIDPLQQLPTADSKTGKIYAVMLCYAGLELIDLTTCLELPLFLTTRSASRLGVELS
jgi:hypothetical protein